MNPFIEQFRDHSTEYLLERRACGEEGLRPEAHEAIELLLIERGVSVPPLPKRSIHMDPALSEPKRSVLARNGVLLVAALLAIGIGKVVAHTWVGLLVTAAFLVFAGVDWFRRQRLSDEDRSREDNHKKAQKEGLTDLMHASADGDLQRVKELLAFGRRANETSHIGSTALMYAARNNHIEVVDALLSAGADPNMKTPKGTTAKDVAAKAGHHYVVARLDQALNKSNAA